jgi:formamidopyrimidine-DNA glycosylase
MIELPEAIFISSQINENLIGKVVDKVIKDQNPHKFAFPMKDSDQIGSEYVPADFQKILKGKAIKKSWSDSNIIFVQLGSDYLLSLGCGGENIIYHENDDSIPKKHQLLIEFTDNTFLTVTISGWGEVRLMKVNEVDKHPHIDKNKIDPLSKNFTLTKFYEMIEQLPENKKCSAKKFYITDPGLRGIGNGVIQDIFFLAKIHPKREMKTLSQKERKTLYETTRTELQKMVRLGGRDSEKDLFGNNGGYQKVMHSKSKGTPCPECQTPITKQQYLGGSIYVCPTCQK